MCMRSLIMVSWTCDCICIKVLSSPIQDSEMIPTANKLLFWSLCEQWHEFICWLSSKKSAVYPNNNRLGCEKVPTTASGSYQAFICTSRHLQAASIKFMRCAWKATFHCCEFLLNNSINSRNELCARVTIKLMPLEIELLERNLN